jgi:hypothetical protein
MQTLLVSVARGSIAPGESTDGASIAFTRSRRKGNPMTDAEKRRTPWFIWPFCALWRLLAFILNATGRLVLAALGIALMVAGWVITLTVVGAPLGVPLAILGFLLLLRALF